MSTQQPIPNISEEKLQEIIQLEYASVARDPHKGYHFHTGRRAADVHGYDEALYHNLPEENIQSFAGTGNPFLAGPINLGEVVVDIGSGAGFDALIAAKMVGPKGRVIGIDMTEEMLDKARAGAAAMGLQNIEFRHGYMEKLPFDDNFADVIISNGVLNLTLNKIKTLEGWNRVLKPGGRLQIGDILITRSVPDLALDDISLWAG